MTCKVLILLLVCVISLCTANTRYRCTGKCPKGVNVFNCFVAPCQFAKCLAHPKAHCCNDYCRGCNAYFYIQQKHGRQWVKC